MKHFKYKINMNDCTTSKRNSFIKTFRTGACKILIFSVVLTLIFLSSSCKNSSTRFSDEDQQVLDSTYYIDYIKAEVKLSDQLHWVKSFYRVREFKLAWFKKNTIVPQAEKMLEVITKAAEEGLDPADYRLADLDKLFKELRASKRDFDKFTEIQKELDVVLTGTYFLWASDYYRGLVVPNENKEIEWDVKQNKIRLDGALMTVLGERESHYPYESFSPLHDEYSRLKASLAEYRKIQLSGGWPTVAGSPKLKRLQSSNVIQAIRKRLGMPETEGSVYNDEVFDAVQKFQAIQGLKPDGVLGAETVKIMNISVNDRIKQIILNMERWRWIPRSFEPDYLLVNIPEYKLYVYEAGKEKLSMNVIVGKAINNTPVFNDKMEYIVLSPYWNVPFSIIKEELAPKIASNSSYLDRLDMEVVTSGGEKINPGSINWKNLTEENWKYVLRRRPGPKNDLGDVKFIFPNSNAIYLHDTPRDELFSQTKRGFSHGCVRVERPMELAEYLLRNSGDWSRSKLIETIAKREEKKVPLKEFLPVYLVYFTAWTDENGQVHFRDDIYGHDKTLAEHYFN
jgi:murein L,D-transpeptidase YcbB/YkuD